MSETSRSDNNTTPYFKLTMRSGMEKRIAEIVSIEMHGEIKDCDGCRNIAQALVKAGLGFHKELTLINDDEMKAVIKENITLLNDEKKAPELLFKVAQAQLDFTKKQLEG